MGFVEERGPLFVPLSEARETYGKWPSDFDLVSSATNRDQRRTLNLILGTTIQGLLREKRRDLKYLVDAFFRRWHRDYEQEFGVRMQPFGNFNDPSTVTRVLRDNAALLTFLQEFDLRTQIAASGMIKNDVLHSIPENDLLATTEKIIRGKLHQLSADKRANADIILLRLRAKHILSDLDRYSAVAQPGADDRSVCVYADEIAQQLYLLSRIIDVRGSETLRYVTGKGVEFQYALRDRSYLTLGKTMGDCTADKRFFQIDRNVENIYWTVFPWIVDRHYQILKVLRDGHLVMKAHLLPLYVNGRIVLGVDAIETIHTLRGPSVYPSEDQQYEERDFIFDALITTIKGIAGAMGLTDIYAERFSNTAWVRSRLDTFPEIYLNVGNIIKIDEMEDVYDLAREICLEGGGPLPREVFMEVQIRNTHLLPEITNRTKGVKSFAVIDGDPEHGIPMKRVIGI